MSPLLANIMLDDLDKELEKRGHRFVRYADDCNIYVGSERAGERVMSSVKRYLKERLKLRVNETKSAVDRPWRRKFLGFSLYRHKGGTGIRIAPESLKRLKAKMRRRTCRSEGQSLKRVAGPPSSRNPSGTLVRLTNCSAEQSPGYRLLAGPGPSEFDRTLPTTS